MIKRFHLPLLALAMTIVTVASALSAADAHRRADRLIATSEEALRLADDWRRAANEWEHAARQFEQAHQHQLATVADNLAVCLSMLPAEQRRSLTGQ